MTPLRTAALVVLFALAALSAVETFVESYHRGGAWWCRPPMKQGPTPIRGQCLVWFLKRSGTSPETVQPQRAIRSSISSIYSEVIELDLNV
jgi:hypothetical protein